MPRENKSKYAILGLLTLQPMSGYDIRKKIAASIGHFWSESYGQIYPILRQLLGEGLATCTTERQTGRPERVVYAITALGEQELRAWLREAVELPVERNELLLKLFFGRHIPSEDTLRRLREFRDHQHQLQTEFESLRVQVEEQLSHLPDAPYWRMAISYGLHTSAALIRWCDEATALLGSGPGETSPQESIEAEAPRTG